MNDTAQETTAVVAMLVELKHETGILLVSFPGPVEKRVHTIKILLCGL